eukprot:scaffold8485_cov110-Isochrysis_galbana.AAC.1
MGVWWRDVRRHGTWLCGPCPLGSLAEMTRVAPMRRESSKMCTEPATGGIKSGAGGRAWRPGPSRMRHAGEWAPKVLLPLSSPAGCPKDGVSPPPPFFLAR